MPAMTVPRQRARPTGGCSCDPPWPLLYTVRNGTWQQAFPATGPNAGATGPTTGPGPAGPARCIGCGAIYTGPWLPHPP
jgi:hypothetical protein